MEGQNAYRLANQAIAVHTFSKYRMDVACSSEVRLIHFRLHAVIKSDTIYVYISLLYHCGVLDSERNGLATVMSENANSALIERKAMCDCMVQR